MKQDALYAEAEQVFRKYVDAEEGAARAGGVTPDGIDEILGGEVLKYFKEGNQKFAAAGLHMASGNYKILLLRRSPGESVEGSAVSLVACVDLGSAQVVNREGKPVSGRVVATRNYFRDEGRGLRLIAQRSWKDSGC